MPSTHQPESAGKPDCEEFDPDILNMPLPGQPEALHLIITVPKASELKQAKQIARTITDQFEFARDLGGALYYQTNGVYRLGGDDAIKEMMMQMLEHDKIAKRWSRHKTNEVIEYVLVGAPLLWEGPPLDRINVLNGILNLNTLVIEPQI
jgi:hypothetical protein